MSFLLNPFVHGAGGGTPTGTPHNRFYLPSTGAAAVSPAFSASWNGTASADRLKGVTTKIGSADTQKSINNIAGTGPAFVLWRQYVFDPVSAQTVSGNVKGQLRCFETSDNSNASVAVLIYFVSNDGSTVRGVVLAISASPTAARPPEMQVTTAQNRKLLDASDNALIALTPLVVLDGDRPVIELGYRQNPASSNTSRVCTAQFGDASGTDLAEDDTTLTANNPWVEFSSAVYFQ